MPQANAMPPTASHNLRMLSPRAVRPELYHGFENGGGVSPSLSPRVAKKGARIKLRLTTSASAWMAWRGKPPAHADECWGLHRIAVEGRSQPWFVGIAQRRRIGFVSVPTLQSGVIFKADGTPHRPS